jgi:hypothetical protein
MRHGSVFLMAIDGRLGEELMTLQAVQLGCIRKDGKIRGDCGGSIKNEINLQHGRTPYWATNEHE